MTQVNKGDFGVVDNSLTLIEAVGETTIGNDTKILCRIFNPEKLTIEHKTFDQSELTLIAKKDSGFNLEFAQATVHCRKVAVLQKQVEIWKEGVALETFDANDIMAGIGDLVIDPVTPPVVEGPVEFPEDPADDPVVDNPPEDPVDEPVDPEPGTDPTFSLFFVDHFKTPEETSLAIGKDVETVEFGKEQLLRGTFEAVPMNADRVGAIWFNVMETEYREDERNSPYQFRGDIGPILETDFIIGTNTLIVHDDVRERTLKVIVTE